MANEVETNETRQENDAARSEPAERRASSLPLALTLVALLVWFGFQAVALVLERNNLTAVKSNYEAATREAEKMRAQLETLITQTAELASKGNANARAVVEELNKRGIPLQSAAPPAK